MSSWWHGYFGEEYLSLGLPELSGPVTKFEVRFLQSRVLRTTDVVLDAACGRGRHALQLAADGYKVLAVDRDKAALSALRSDTEANDLSLDIVEADVCDLADHVSPSVVGATICLGYSFGYSLDDSANSAFLTGLAYATAHGGVLLLECPNATRALAEPVIRTWRRAGEVLLLWEISADPNAGIVCGVEHRIFAGGARRARPFFLRVYSLDELTILLQDSGFSPVQVWGGFDGSALSSNSEQLLLLARRN